jgi:hypothetical protein
MDAPTVVDDVFCGTVHAPEVTTLLESVPVSTFKCSDDALVRIPTTATGRVRCARGQGVAVVRGSLGRLMLL